MKKHWKQLLTVALVILLAAALSVSALAADDDDPGVAVSKVAKVQEDGTYIIELEAFSTGEVKIVQEVKPCDVILVLDTSYSMVINNMDNITGYTQVTNGNTSINSWSGNWNTNPRTNTQYYYKDADGNYHQITITRTQSGNWYSAYYAFTFAVKGFSGTDSTLTG